MKTILRRISLAVIAILMLGTYLPALSGGGVQGARAAVLDAGDDVDYVRLKNNYTGKYLLASEGKVAYGNPEETDPASHWLIEEHEGKQRIKNRLTGLYMSVENWEGFWSPVELQEVGPDYSVVEWTIMNAVTSGFHVIQSAVDPARYLHMQDNNGYAQSSEIPPDWGSVQWALEPVVDYVRIVNNYTGQYLTASEDQVGYGNPDERDPASHWLIEEHEGKQRIKNRLTGLYMSVENWEGFWSPVELREAGSDSSAVEWTIMDAVTIGFYVIQSAVDPARYLHIQDNNGYAQSSDIPSDWGTVQWAFQPVFVTEPYESDADDGPQYIRIKNDWLGLYMYEDDGELVYGNALLTDHSSQWIIEEEEGIQRIRNRATGHYISRTGVTSDKMAVSLVETDHSAASEQWVIENLQTAGTKLIRSQADEEQFLHVENQFGFVQYGIVPRDWGSPKWSFIPVSDSDSPTIVRFINSFTGKVLYEEDQRVKYGDPAYEDGLSHWVIEDAGNGTSWIKNRVTGHYMNIEGMDGGVDPHLLPLNSSEIEESWSSAKWTLAVTADVYVISNVYKPEQLIHVEDGTGYAQSSSIPANWGSAQWTLQAAPADLPIEVPDGYVRLKNAETSQYLYENEYGIVIYGSTEWTDSRSHWKFVEQGKDSGQYQLINRATGHVITMQNGEAFLESLEIPDSASADTNQWFVDPAPGSGNVLLRSAEHPLEYIHIQDRTGYAQLGLRSIESAALQWIIEAAPIEGDIPESTGPSERIQTSRLDDTRSYVLMNSKDGIALVEDEGLVGTGGPESGGSIWTLQDMNGYKLLRNQGSGRYLIWTADGLRMDSIPDDVQVSTDMQWRLVQRSGNSLLESASQPGMYLSIAGIAELVAADGQSPIDAIQLKLVPVTQDVVLEGEEAFLRSGAAIGQDARGFVGAGYADLNQAGAEAMFNVYADTEGIYDANIRYANGTDADGSLSVMVNGLNVRQITIPATGSWDTWSEQGVQFTLRRGNNTVSIKQHGHNSPILIDNLAIANIIPQAYRGASVSYGQYEAEYMVTNGQVIGPDRTYREFASEASGRQAVKLEGMGDYVEFTLDHAANRVTIRYSIPDSADGSGMNGSLGVYVDGDRQNDFNLTSQYAWVYGSYPWSNKPEDGDAHRFFDESSITVQDLEAGSVIRFMIEADSGVPYIILDVVETDWTDGPYTQPDGYLSILDFGATPDDDTDDTAAIQSAILAGSASGAGVWIPAGTFRVDSGPLEAAEVTIRGAGKWHSVLAGGGFMALGNRVQIYDLAIDGEVDARHDERDESGFDGSFGAGSTIQHVRIDRTKTGIWVTAKELDNGEMLSTEGLYVSDIQIRNTYADGINFSTGTSHSMAEQLQLRNTGDDGMAMWANGEQSVGNTFRFNTVELPWLSNNIAVYGGRDVTISDNVVSDTFGFGAGISISTRHDPMAFEGTTLVERNTMLRAGGREFNWKADFGGLFLYTGDRDMIGDIQIRDNLIYDSTYQGISFLGEKLTSGIVLKDNVVDGTGSWGINTSGNIKGSALFGDTIVRGVRVGEWMDGAANFTLNTKDEGFSFTEHSFELRVDGQPVRQLTLEAGDSVQLTVYPEDMDGDAVWRVSDNEIAVVDSDGRMTGIRHGTVLLTVQYGGVSRTFTVQVADSTSPEWPEIAELTTIDNGGGTVTVSWPAVTANSGSVTYRIAWNGGFKTVAAPLTEASINGLTSGKLYTIQVDAHDSAGNWATQTLSGEIRPANSGGTGSGGMAPTNDGLLEAPIMTEREDGTTAVEITIRAKALQEAFAKANEEGRLQIDIDLNANEDVVEAILPAADLLGGANMLANGVIVIKRGGASYELPLALIAPVLSNSSDALVKITMERMTESKVHELTELTGEAPKSEVYQFRIVIESNGITTVWNDFNHVYVARTIDLSQDVSVRTATGVVFDETLNRWRHVPTVFRTLPDGSIQAMIQSTTNSLYAVIESARAFADMTDHWAAETVHVLASKRILDGVGNNRFLPEQAVTRAEFAKMLTTALGLPVQPLASFTDVESDVWYAGPIEAAVNAGIVTGYDDGSFRPNERITREQMIAMTMRAYRLAAHVSESDNRVLHAYQDANRISEWAIKDMQSALGLGIVQGRSADYLAPLDWSTRAEAATVLENVMTAMNFINE